MQKPSVPKGTRDFTPESMVRRKYIFHIIEEVFKLFGYQPLETPAMENLSTLLGKYGEEGDKLLFKVLNSGDFLNNIPDEKLKPENAGKLSLMICEKGLRYDLTVPFARFVVQHRNEITFPFKRYQIQPVWRADKPQKGRYREFYQCDVDIIGSNSLLNEVELIQIIDEVFSRLGIKILIKLNNRKILAGIAEIIGEPDKLLTITVLLDKLDKIGTESMMKELAGIGINPAGLERIKPILNLEGNYQKKMDILRNLLSGSPSGEKGLQETESLFDLLKYISPCSNISWDVTLARGLDYYTGTIIEVTTPDDQMGSVCGGGRYDNLAGIFGMENISGVGVSFGAERIFDIMVKLELFPESAVTGTSLLFVNLGEKEVRFILPILSTLRKAGICAEIYPDYTKLNKQMAFANTKHIPFVAFVGEKEMKDNRITLRNMQTGEQMEVDINGLIEEIKL